MILVYKVDMKESLDFKIIRANYLYVKNAAIAAYSDGLESFWQMKQLTLEENHDEYLETFESAYQQLLPGIILMATAIEGYINAYGKYLISAKEFKRYDKLSTLDKLGLFYRFKTGKEIDRGTKLLEDSKALFSLRNKIIHEKPQIINVKQECKPDIDLFGIRGEVIKGAINSIDLFDRLSYFIAEIEGLDECPIITMTVSNSIDYQVKIDEKIDEYFNPIINTIDSAMKILTDKINEYEKLSK